jgi:hypothetical protein
VSPSRRCLASVTNTESFCADLSVVSLCASTVAAQKLALPTHGLKTEKFISVYVLTGLARQRLSAGQIDANIGYTTNSHILFN